MGQKCLQENCFQNNVGHPLKEENMKIRQTLIKVFELDVMIIS